MIPLGAVAIVSEEHVVIVMVALAKSNKRDPPAISAAVPGAMRLGAPHMTDRIDAERRIEHEKGAPHTGQDKTTESTHPSAIEEPHDKGKRKPRQDNRDVILILPHNERIFPQRLFVFLFTIRRLDKQPSTMAIPKSLGRIVGIFLSITSRVMTNMVRAPSQCRVLERPPASYEETRFHPRFAFKASMRNQTVVAHRDTETGNEIQHDEHGPIESRKSVEVSKQRHADDGRDRHDEKEHNRRVIFFEVRLLHSYPPVTLSMGLVDQARKIAAYDSDRSGNFQGDSQ